MSSIVEVDDLVKHFGGLHAVDGVTLAVEPGETLAVIGPNGAGKTTLFNLIAGAETPTSGRIRIRGTDVTDEAAYRRTALGVTRSFQSLGLMPRESVLTNVLAKLHGEARYSVIDPILRPWRVRREESRLRDLARHWIEAVGLGDRAESPVRDLSFGLARRAEMAAILATNPALVLLDEPSAGLTSEATKDLLGLLEEMRAEHGTTILLIGHDLGFVLQIADRVIAMQSGTVLAEGTPEEIRDHPAVVEAYLGQPIATRLRRPAKRAAPDPLAPPTAGFGLAVGNVHAGYTLAPVLSGASLAVKPGELAAIAGQNGAGKSTLLKVIHGQLGLADGWVAWNGRRIEHLSTADRVRLGIAHVPQGRLLFPDFTVERNLLLAAQASGVDIARAVELLARGLDLFPRLEERLTQPAGSLSGGEQQMLALARGLMSDPQMLLLDEVSQGLSPKMAGELRTALIGIKALGIAVLVIEHRPWLLDGVADTVHLLDRGSITWSGSLDDAMRRGLLLDVHLGEADHHDLVGSDA